MKIYKIRFYFTECEKIVVDFVQARSKDVALDKLKWRYGSAAVIDPKIELWRKII